MSTLGLLFYLMFCVYKVCECHYNYASLVLKCIMLLNATIIFIDILSMITTTSEKLSGRKYICHLSQVGRQMAIKNTVSNDFWSAFVDSINVFNCPLSGVQLSHLGLVIIKSSNITLKMYRAA